METNQGSSEIVYIFGDSLPPLSRRYIKTGNVGNYGQPLIVIYTSLSEAIG